jgi:diguanylate cyclase (GGDEF)-like protein/PAS domain S-box-containing protein
MATSGSEHPADLTVRMTRDSVGVITSIDDAVGELLGWRPEELIGSPSTRFIHPADQSSAVAAWMEMITSPGVPRIWRGRYQTAAGAWMWVETVNCLEDGEHRIVSSSMARITGERVSIEEELRAREQLLSRLSDALPVGVFQMDRAGCVTFTNDRLLTMVGVPHVATIEAQLSMVIDEDKPLLDVVLAAVLTDQPVDEIEIRLRLPTGDTPGDEQATRVCMLSLRALTDSDGAVNGAVGCLSDVTDRVQLHRELEVRASVDKLTACLNRGAVIDLLETTIATPRAASDGIAVVFLDLDRFKSVNDRFGHAAGDRFLAAAADRIRGAVRECDRVGRLGGDEFLVICPRVESAAQAQVIAGRIADVMTSTVEVGPCAVELRASIGVAWTTEALNADAFIEQADRAMYESKRAGNGRVTMLIEKPQLKRARTSRVRRHGTS